MGDPAGAIHGLKLVDGPPPMRISLPAAGGTVTGCPTPELTPRHWELLRLVAAGHTNSQIARRLGLSEATVRKHLENIYGRLQVSSRTAAVTRAFPDRVA